MRKNILLAVILSAVAFLSGCTDKPTSPTPAAAPTAAVVTPKPADIERQAKGFTVGSLMATRTVYVFFDAQCPHCAKLWVAAKPLQNQAKFVWIPVGILNKASTSQGATILGAKDPASAMDQHEASLGARTGGITADTSLTELQAVVGKNTELLKSFNVSSIPFTVTANPTTGETIQFTGGAPTDMLAARLGLKAPAVATAPAVAASAAK